MKICIKQQNIFLLSRILYQTIVIEQYENQNNLK